MNFRDQTTRNFGEINRYLDSQELLCPVEKRKTCYNFVCGFFHKSTVCRAPGYCTLGLLRRLIGAINSEESTMDIVCPLCGWKQTVPVQEYLFQSTQGHGHTCGSGKCPSHTYMVPYGGQDSKGRG